MSELSPNATQHERLYLCRANGEGQHSFRICADEAAVMVFYEEMFGLDMDGKLDSAIEHFRDADNWSNGGEAYHCELYCATFEVWKVTPSEMSLAPSATALMSEERASEILKGEIQPNGGLYNGGWYVAWTPGEVAACLDDKFTADELEAIAWWMRNKGKP